MPYATQSDLEHLLTPQRLAQLSDLDADGAADTDVVADACARASREIDGYISPRYTVPIAGTTPELLRAIAARWAVYLLMLDRDSVTDSADTQHKADVRFMERVGEGKASLGDPVNAPEGDAAHGMAFGSEDARFTRAKLKGW